MASHTATGEWKSFEGRMRRRRVERLLLRADVAFEEGCVDAAGACLHEAEQLAPGLPAIVALKHRLEAPPPVSAATPVASTFRKYVLPTIAAAAAIGIAAPVWHFTSDQGANIRALALPAAPAEFRLKAELPLNAGSPAMDLPVALRPTAEFRLEPEGTRDLPVVRDQIDAGPVEALPRSVRVVPSIDRPPDPAAVSARVETPVEGIRAADDLAVAGTEVTLPREAAVVTTPGDTAVRRTLDRYADAYNALDAAAAQRVWPGVNRAALTRAFGALASQRVSLGDCRIDVTGATARASCAGSATWAARIGDASSRTEARRWTFDLARAGDEWRIVTARTQNR
jgi:hypothetical protein